jgi:hypothetical protein
MFGGIFLNPNHIIPCRKLEASCSLEYDIKIKSTEEGINHKSQCLFSIEKCTICD